MLPSLHISLPFATHAAPGKTSFNVAAPRISKLHGPRTARVGGTLTISGSTEGTPGPVTIQGTYGREWKTLSIVELDRGGAFRVAVALPRRGLLHVRVLYPDGSRAVGSTRVR